MRKKNDEETIVKYFQTAPLPVIEAMLKVIKGIVASRAPVLIAKERSGKQKKEAGSSLFPL